MKLLFNKNRNDQYDEEQICMTVIARFGTGGNTPLILEKTYQDKTGTLSPGAHAGSYNGQDAYNDMLVVENEMELLERRADSGNVVGSECGGWGVNECRIKKISML